MNPGDSEVLPGGFRSNSGGFQSFPGDGRLMRFPGDSRGNREGWNVCVTSEGVLELNLE